MKLPVLRSLLKRGGTALNSEIRDDVARVLELGPEVLDIPHDPARGRRSEFEYRLAWARTQLSKSGEIVRSGNRRWSLTEAGRDRVGDLHKR